MAEILGVGISVASLVIQIVDSLSKAISFYESIREAPDDVQRLLIELHLLSNIISVIQNMVSTSSIPKDTESVLKSALTLIRRDVAALSSLSSELDDKLKSERRFIRTWARVQTVFSDKKISVLKRHLESTKGGMHLLQGCIIVDKISNLDFRAREIPKQLGYHWEAGERERHLKIDDGLDEPFFIPLDLCSNPEDLISLLDLKYRSRKLPGLSQIRQGHLAVFDWTRNFKVDFDNWNMVVKPGGRIKIAFLMSSWHGLSRTKCTRCFKPYKVGTTSFGFRNCFSCGLEVLRVEPQAITFETADIQIGLGADQYRDYQISKRNRQRVIKTPRGSSGASDKSIFPEPRSTRSFDDPPIDLVCKRLVVKWEPIYNIVHRYLHCRCVLRKSTPSSIEKELTLLILAVCPRHNIINSSRQDYGNIDYDRDPYFDLFGGYRAFQGFVYLFTPNIYRILGGERFVPAQHLDEAVKVINKRIEEDPEGLEDVFSDYYFEVNDAVENAGIELPEREAKFVEVERQRRREKSLASCKEFGIGLDGRGWEFTEEQYRMWSESPMMQEFRDIIDRKWDGKYHWEVENNMEQVQGKFCWAK